MNDIILNALKNFKIDDSLFTGSIPLAGKIYYIPTTPRELLELKKQIITDLKEYSKTTENDNFLENNRKTLIYNLTQESDIEITYNKLINYFYYYKNNLTPQVVKDIEIELIKNLGGKFLEKRK